MRKSLLLLFILLTLLSLSLAEDKGDKKPGTAPSPAIDTTRIIWVPYDIGLQQAKESGKHILVDFTAKWCGYCKKMDRETFSDPEVIKFLNSHFINAKVDGDSKNELNIDGYKITEHSLAKTEFRVSGYPTFYFLKANSERIGGISGYRPKDFFLDMLYFVKDDLYTKMTFEQYLKNGGRKKNN